MIISLKEAQKINPRIEQSYLDGLEVAIRQYTNNRFLNAAISFRGFEVTDENKLTFKKDVKYIRVDDTIQLADSKVNDGLYTVSEVQGNTITINGTLFDGKFHSGLLSKVEYPADVIAGVKKLLEYDLAMSDKVGIKSETISRMSKTYYDVNSTENINGYPSAYMSFLKKYRKLRW